MNSSINHCTNITLAMQSSAGRLGSG